VRTRRTFTDSDGLSLAVAESRLDRVTRLEAHFIEPLEPVMDDRR
jgi:uncharacterized protein YciW